MFWTGLQFVRRGQRQGVRRAAEVMFLVLLVMLPLNIIRKDFLHISFFDLTPHWSLGARVTAVMLLVCSGIWAIWRYFHYVFEGARTIVWLLVLLMPMTLLQTARLSKRDKPAAFLDQRTAAVLGNAADRAIIVVFDELDLGFVTARPSAIQMPEWDRLSNESLHARRTSSPATDTLEAIPSILTGRRVNTATPESVDTLLIHSTIPATALTGNNSRRSSPLAHEAGLNVGVSGWYHPYCRLFGMSTVSCFWMPARRTPPERINGQPERSGCYGVAI